MTTATKTDVLSIPDELPVPEGLTGAERGLYRRIPTDTSYVAHPSFTHPETEEELFGQAARSIDVPEWTHFVEVPEDLSLMRTKRPALRAEEERYLFRRYNYARCRLARLIEAQLRRRSLVRARGMLVWFSRAMVARAELVRANMPLVLAMARRVRIPNADFGEVVSEGNMALLRSVEKFDVSRGFKFSTYACRAILKSFNRLATKTGRYRQRFPMEFDPDLERSDYDVNRHEIQRRDSIDAVREILAGRDARLTDVERTVLMERFAIGSQGKGKTLAEVGRMVGLTSERVRQIQKLALDKVREVLDEEHLVA